MIFKILLRKMKQLRDEIFIFIGLSLIHTITLLFIAYLLMLFNFHQIDLSNLVLNVDSDTQIRVPI